MDAQAEKASFRKNMARLNVIVAQAQAAATRPSVFKVIISALTIFGAAPKLSLNDAWNGITAASTVLEALAEKANTYDEIHFYNSILQILTDELTHVVATDWQSRTKAYAPFTRSFKDSASSLKKIKEKADQLADQLNLAADVIGAFTKLLSGFSV